MCCYFPKQNSFGLKGVFICVIICTYAVIYMRFPETLNKQSAPTRVTKPLKKILYWTYYFHHDNFNFGSGRKAFQAAGCLENRCHATQRRMSLPPSTPVEEFDAILFHGWNFDAHDIPTVRRPHQRYILYLLEPPGIFPDNLQHLPEGFFNWTMTYRLDSDILASYGYFKRLTEPPEDIMPPTTNWYKFPSNFRETDLPERTLTKIANKTKLVAWFVSHCETPGKRENYVRELAQYISIDTYGLCGNLKCHLNEQKECYQKLEDNYMFYLSFENSKCQDYVTEKLYRVMRYNVVPIVYGGGQYSLMAPPQSYIHTDDFEKPWHLAQYLLDLNANREDYARYFWWKSYYEAKHTNAHRFCKLCAVLHEEGLPTKNYSDVHDWFARPGICQQRDDIYSF